MTLNEKDLKEFVDRQLPSPSNEEIDQACDRVLDRLVLIPRTLQLPCVADRKSQSALWRLPLAPRTAVVVAAMTSAVVAAVLLLPWPRPIAVVENVDSGLYRVVEGKAQSLLVNDKLQMGETIHSNGGSGGTLLLGDGSRVEMRSQSNVSLERIDDGIRILLHKGSVIVNAAKQAAGRHLYVRTKDVLVSVVGTVFLVNTEEEGSRVAVIAGEVRVRQGETENDLLPGQQVATSPQMKPLPVKEGISWSRNAEAHTAALVRQTQVQAQSSLRFEVASVRRVEIPPTDRGVPVFPITGGVGTSDPSRITYRATWLQPLIAAAFGVRTDQITGPAWLTTERYDIVATIPEGATKEQFNIMLGNLLRDRFHLRFHIESTILPVYALRVGKDGPKFEQTARRADDTAPPGISGARDPQDCPILPPHYQGMVGWPKPGQVCWTAQDVPIQNLAGLIERPAGRPILDETGLTGRYDFKIRFEQSRRPADAGVASDPAPSIFAAVEEQLGLKLESANSPFDQLVIDSIDREPTDN